jgi:undecaprenyl diphosphate synthase
MFQTLLKLFGIYKIYRWYLLSQIKNKPMPSHIAVILDGNRRWASEKDLPAWMGHKVGASKVKMLLDKCLELNIKTLTLYAFSTENFQRTKDEVEKIMEIAAEKLDEIISSPDIHTHKIKVKLVGKKEILPEFLVKKFEEVENLTKDYSNHYLNIAMAYGGRIEIVDAVKKIAEEVKQNKLKPENISEEEIEKRLYTSHLPNPYPDLIIRTSGEERLSGFLLWQAAYSELCFLDVYWPDFRDIDLYRAIRTYQKRDRRFGK